MTRACGDLGVTEVYNGGVDVAGGRGHPQRRAGDRPSVVGALARRRP